MAVPKPNPYYRPGTTLDSLVVPCAVPQITLDTADLNKLCWVNLDDQRAQREGRSGEYRGVHGYGCFDVLPGLPYRVEFPPGQNLSAPTLAKNVIPICSFFAISDIHITDKESPLQVIALGYGEGKKSFHSAYSGVILYTLQVLESAIRTVNILHGNKKFDFGISLGDVVNNAQKNELDWYIGVMKGGLIKPTSTVKGGWDFQKQFTAQGLSIKWYQAIGNHDQFWTGVGDIDDTVTKYMTGDKVAKVNNKILETGKPWEADDDLCYCGTMDCSGGPIYSGCSSVESQGKVVGVGKVAQVSDHSLELNVTPCDGRKPIGGITKFVEAFKNMQAFGTSSDQGTPLSTSAHRAHPSRHARPVTELHDACYHFYMDDNKSIKFIVLDDTSHVDQITIETHGLAVHGGGDLDQQRLEWLEKELNDGQSKGQLMVIFSHVPLKYDYPTKPRPADKMDLDQDAMKWYTDSRDKVKNLLKHYPGVILWVAGHVHRSGHWWNAHDEDNSSAGGFWGVCVPSLRDFPQQLGTIEIFENDDKKTLSIFVTAVDAVAANDLKEQKDDEALRICECAKKSRMFAIASAQAENGSIGHKVSNVQLIINNPLRKEVLLLHLNGDNPKLLQPLGEIPFVQVHLQNSKAFQFTPKNLSNYDLIVWDLHDHGSSSDDVISFSLGTQEAIVDFVKYGGAILVTHDVIDVLQERAEDNTKLLKLVGLEKGSWAHTFNSVTVAQPDHPVFSSMNPMLDLHHPTTISVTHSTYSSVPSQNKNLKVITFCNAPLSQDHYLVLKESGTGDGRTAYWAAGHTQKLTENEILIFKSTVLWLTRNEKRLLN